MSSKYLKPNGKNRTSGVGMDTFIERLKKIRALNCSPSDVGIDSYMWKRLSAGNSGLSTK